VRYDVPSNPRSCNYVQILQGGPEDDGAGAAGEGDGAERGETGSLSYTSPEEGPQDPLPSHAGTMG
jgi:hypothetical protein